MHTKEPWFIKFRCVGSIDIQHDHGVNQIEQIANVIIQDNARRIVACVNACAGIPTEMLEAGNGVADAVRHFQTQRDELLAALKLARAELDKLPRSLGYDFDHIHAIDAAIAKCES